MYILCGHQKYVVNIILYYYCYYYNHHHNRYYALYIYLYGYAYAFNVGKTKAYSSLVSLYFNMVFDICIERDFTNIERTLQRFTTNRRRKTAEA